MSFAGSSLGASNAFRKGSHPTLCVLWIHSFSSILPPTHVDIIMINGGRSVFELSAVCMCNGFPLFVTYTSTLTLVSSSLLLPFVGQFSVLQEGVFPFE